MFQITVIFSNKCRKTENLWHFFYFKKLCNKKMCNFV